MSWHRGLGRFIRRPGGECRRRSSLRRGWWVMDGWWCSWNEFFSEGERERDRKTGREDLSSTTSSGSSSRRRPHHHHLHHLLLLLLFSFDRRYYRAVVVWMRIINDERIVKSEWGLGTIWEEAFEPRHWERERERKILPLSADPAVFSSLLSRFLSFLFFFSWGWINNAFYFSRWFNQSFNNPSFLLLEQQQQQRRRRRRRYHPSLTWGLGSLLLHVVVLSGSSCSSSLLLCGPFFPSRFLSVVFHLPFCLLLFGFVYSRWKVIEKKDRVKKERESRGIWWGCAFFSLMVFCWRFLSFFCRFHSKSRSSSLRSSLLLIPFFLFCRP